MAGILTKKGIAKIAQKQAAVEPLNIANFIFAYIDGLDPTQNPAEDEQIPAESFIQYRAPITRAGFVNPSEVVYSIIIGSDVGDWDFNWLGLEDEDGDLFAVIYLPTQRKIKNIPPVQIGNMITRNFLVGFKAIADITQITIPAESWQFDITDVINHIEEKHRQDMRAIFGRACFFKNGFQVIKNADNSYSLAVGTGFVEGLRLVAEQSIKLAVGTHKKIWLDVFTENEHGKTNHSYQIAYGEQLVDYTDPQGRKHYLTPLATITEQQLIDHRPYFMEQSIVEAISNDPNSDPKNIASIGALQALKEDLITNNNDFSGSGQLTKEQRGIVNIDASLADTVITLPPANAEHKGVEYTLRRVDNSNHMLQVKAADNDAVMFHLQLSNTGFPHFELFGAGDYWSIYSNGAGKWFVVSRYDNTPMAIPQPYMSALMPIGGYFPVNRQPFNVYRFPWLTVLVMQSQMFVEIEQADEPANMGKWAVDMANEIIYSPNLGGEFIRALDSGRGVDVGREPGSWQADELKQHKHELKYGAVSGGGVGPSLLTDEYNPKERSTENSGGIETRPRNIAYPFIFKVI